MSHPPIADTRHDDAVVADGGLGWKDLTGFQRDVLRALYAVEIDRRRLTDNADRGFVASEDVLHKLRDFPTYSTANVETGHFYPTTRRLKDRDWITVQPATSHGDTRRRQYALTDEARAIIQAVLETDKHIVNASTDPTPDQATLPDGGPSR